MRRLQVQVLPRGPFHQEAKAEEIPPPVGSRMDRGSRRDCGAGPLASASFRMAVYRDQRARTVLKTDRA